MNVTEFPTSVGFCEEEMLTDGSAFTVSVIVFDWAELPRLSFITTYIESDPADENEVVYVDDVAPDMAFPFRYHWYEYEPVPPEAEAVSVMLLPTSVGFWLEVIETEGPATTLIVSLTTGVFVPVESTAYHSAVYVPADSVEK